MEQALQACRRRKALMAALAIPCAAAASAVLLYVWAAEPGRAGIPLCFFNALTGLYCPGCGTTRALHLLLHGHFWLGLRMNPLAVLGAPFLFACLSASLLRLWQGRPLPKLPGWLAWAALAIIVLYTVARNLPWMPFSWLAPTAAG